MSSDVFDMKFLQSALDVLSEVFCRVCDKKSSSISDKSEFEKTKISILNSFESFITRPDNTDLENSADKGVHDSDMADLDMNSIILEEIRILAARTADFQSTTSERLNIIENKLRSDATSSVEPTFALEIKGTETDDQVQSERRSYVQVARENLLSLGESKSINIRNPPRLNDDHKELHSDRPPNHTQALRASESNTRKQKEIISGKNTNTRLKSAVRYPRKAAIFVSRLNRSTQVNDVIDFLGPLNLKHQQCTQMKTRYDSYASFHIETLDSEQHLLLKDSLWPEGCIVTKFLGRLKQDQILDVNSCVPPSRDEISASAITSEGSGSKESSNN